MSKPKSPFVSLARKWRRLSSSGVLSIKCYSAVFSPSSSAYNLSPSLGPWLAVLLNVDSDVSGLCFKFNCVIIKRSVRKTHSIWCKSVGAVRVEYDSPRNMTRWSRAFAVISNKRLFRWQKEPQTYSSDFRPVAEINQLLERSIAALLVK